MVDNQHKKISGYRDLSEKEIEQMNSCKAYGNHLRLLIEDMEKIPETDKRCLALAKTNFQQGMMWLVRSIAKPEGF